MVAPAALVFALSLSLSHFVDVSVAFVAPTMVSSPPRPSAASAQNKEVITGASTSEWSPSSWRSRVAHQMPVYNDQEKLKEAENMLARQSPLVFAGEVRE
jgi:3-deoxy-7-phosphoheptulonate synthase